VQGQAWGQAQTQRQVWALKRWRSQRQRKAEQRRVQRSVQGLEFPQL
jgi:hypothetical protein